MDEGFHVLKIAAVLLILTLSIGVATARAATSFPDPVGDVKGGSGPDLTSVKRTVYFFEGSRHACYEWLQCEAPELQR